ncbi:TPA: hypothetical protein HA335_06145 [Methanocaldococcus jannaschii]|uniref:Uncharacterized protein MJ0259 n=2 Tax=Methanocaldococcus jannaschii TaxID=2190 RepID=Y259_METJA|nr:hypothetical protein [Methanocaldococcus jannaschii]Q57707.1 RecName: Full=Uncharacterized protein MJ0259 [Methanocaldococcus jannaschii DSM 2661]AAB98250.1 hypothetical protein MJ_0259 [Methanocaldococcus jannaschii DSM 2661]HII60128.1 hypothetical protein [Methanocaldococcus jannaschii]
MKKLLLIIGIISLMTSMSMCLNNNNLNNLDLKKSILVEVNGTPIEIPLRATVGEAKEVKLINTTDREIYNYYHSKILIYIKGDMNISVKEGGVSIVDLVTKLEWFNQFYPHNIVVELNRTNSTVTVKSIFANGKTSITELKVNESEYLMHNNKTMVIEILKTHNTATITKINNTFIIEGNSLKELDNAETRFVIDMFKGSIT